MGKRSSKGILASFKNSFNIQSISFAHNTVQVSKPYVAGEAWKSKVPTMHIMMRKMAIALEVLRCEDTSQTRMWHLRCDRNITTYTT